MIISSCNTNIIFCQNCVPSILTFYLVPPLQPCLQYTAGLLDRSAKIKQKMPKAFFFPFHLNSFLNYLSKSFKNSKTCIINHLIFKF